MEKKKSRVFRIGDRDVEVSIEDLEAIYFKNLRPRLLDYEDFKVIRRILKNDMKKYLRGRIFHVSKVTDKIWDKMTKDADHKVIQRGKTYVKK